MKGSELEVVMLQRDDARMSVAPTDYAIELRDEALMEAALIGKVTNANENETAVEAQKALTRIAKLCEESRKVIKEPVIDYGRKIDAAAKEFRAEIDAEELRIAGLIADYQALELAKVRAAESVRSVQMGEIERARQEALSKATSHEDMDRINEEYNLKVAEIPPVPVVKAEGQRITEDWDIQITDIWALARAHPACVKIEARKTEIRELLKIGVTPAGVLAKRVVKAGVRVAA